MIEEVSLFYWKINFEVKLVRKQFCHKLALIENLRKNAILFCCFD